jgi:hypothetical protein
MSGVPRPRTRRARGATPERRAWGERFARKIFLVCGGLGLLLALSCVPWASEIWDISSVTFLRAVLALPLLWVGLRGTYVTTRNLRRIRRELRAGTTGAGGSPR